MLDTHPWRVRMLQYASFHGLALESGFDPRRHGPLGHPGREFLGRIQKHMHAAGNASVAVTRVLDAATRTALTPPRPSWQDEFVRITKQDAANPNAAYYTQGAERWQGVRAIYGDTTPGKIPALRSGDCSAGYTRWVLWGLQQALGRVPHDVVNGAAWQAGYTGTIALTCKRVTTPQVGDAVLYGRAPYEHVTGIINVQDKLCCSHGGDDGPVIGRWDYRSDLAGFWRPVVDRA